MVESEYTKFLELKAQSGSMSGFDPVWIPDFLHPFQGNLTDWSIRKGRSAIFADCGLGKTPMQLVWAENVLRKTNKPVLVITPLGVAAQTIREGEKFGVECKRSKDGRHGNGIVLTNYERLHYFDPSDFSGAVCDESSAIKNFAGERRKEVTEFLRTIPYRLLCTATAAPNDYIELGTSSEAIGELGNMDMLAQFFKNDENSLFPIWYGSRWRFKRHAEYHFWRWVCSWARACRKPSDLGFSDDGFVLPPLEFRETIVECPRDDDDGFFVVPAETNRDQLAERRKTLRQRCECVAEKLSEDSRSSGLAWCHLNQEADLLEKIIPDALQVSGSMPDDLKEERFIAFSSGQLRVLVVKPKIGAFGLNWQHCSRMTFFPSHSYEQFYQGVRRCWRFGQTKPVIVDIVTTEGEIGVMKNLQRKSEAADRMFDNLVRVIGREMHLKRSTSGISRVDVPDWVGRDIVIEGDSFEGVNPWDLTSDAEEVVSHHPERDSWRTDKDATGISRTGWNKWNSTGRNGRSKR